VNFGAFAADRSGHVRELATPWSAVTGHGIPSAFLFFGYLTSSGGLVYGQLPLRNPNGSIGTSAIATNYYAVRGTADTGSMPPFLAEAATHAGAPAEDAQDILDLSGTWQGNIAAPTAPATINTWQIKQQGRNLSVTQHHPCGGSRSHQIRAEGPEVCQPLQTARRQSPL